MFEVHRFGRETKKNCTVFGKLNPINMMAPCFDSKFSEAKNGKFYFLLLLLLLIYMNNTLSSVCFMFGFKKKTRILV